MTPIIPNTTELWLVMPEIGLILAMCAVLAVPFIRRDSVTLPTLTAMGGLGIALLFALTSTSSAMDSSSQAIFKGMLTVDPFSQFFKALLVFFTLLIVVQWRVAGRASASVFDAPDFLCLLLGATAGMALMASASHLLMIFIATESASMPSFVLAGFRKRTRIGSEGALKYVVFGSAASAIMLYGMSLIYGSTGTMNLQEIVWSAKTHGVSPLLAVGLMAMFAGFAFKLSAVPMHFWCPDVFEGAPIEVTTFLSVASKGAAVCLLLRVLHAFGESASLGFAAASSHFMGLAVGIAIIGAATATWGNLVAMHQNNIKRLLAYSSIAHAGYMVMAAGTAAVAAGTDELVGALLFYLTVYLFMNLGAFTVAALIAQQTGHEDIRQYAGLMRRSPLLATLLSLFLLSLFGMPGLGGFMGKVYLMISMAQVGSGAFALIAVLLLNTLLSLYFYLKPVYFMVFATDSSGQNHQPIPVRPAAMAILLVCTAALLWTGLLPSSVRRYAQDHGQIGTKLVRQVDRSDCPTTTPPNPENSINRNPSFPVDRPPSTPRPPRTPRLPATSRTPRTASAAW